MRLRDKKANEQEGNINEHLSSLQQEEQLPRDGDQGSTREPNESLTWNGQQGKEFENFNQQYNDRIIYFKK